MRRRPSGFLLAWLVPAWVMFGAWCLTKLPHYVLPVYPALALLAAAALADGVRLAASGAGRGGSTSLVRVLWAAVSLALSVLLIGLPLRFGGHIAIGIFGAVLLLVLAGALLWYRPGPGITTGVVAGWRSPLRRRRRSACCPGLDRLWLSRGAAALVARHPPSGRRAAGGGRLQRAEPGIPARHRSPAGDVARRGGGARRRRR